MIVIRISFIGAGKVGFSLGKYFKENNLDVVGYYSRNLESAKEAADFTDTKCFNDLQDVIDNSDAIFITTPDSVIEEVWNKLKSLSVKNKIICHCSGSLSSNIFSNIEEHNSFGYSIHPMFAISDKYNSYKDLKKAFITIEGDSKYLDDLKMLIESLGNKVKVISKENKALYHAASVTVSNQVIALIQYAVEYLENCGFQSQEALEALYPLIINNLNNVKEKGLINSLTGPIERGDVNTVKAHLNFLDSDKGELYKLLSRKLVEIAKIKNSEKNYNDLEEVLGE